MTQTAAGTLIQRLEACTSADRGLDAEIARLVGAQHGPREIVDVGSRSVEVHAEIAPEYTTSLDAAVSLVPEGWFPRIEPRFYSEYDKFEKQRVLYRAYCLRPRWNEASPVNEDYFDRAEFEEGHPSPAIALVLACLRAREAT